MTLQMIQEKYIGKRLNLYLIDGEDVTLDKSGTLTFRFQAEIFGDEALEVTNNRCEANLTLGEDHTIVDVAPLFCQQELELDEDDFLLLECTPTGEHYMALHYALMCAVIRE